MSDGLKKALEYCDNIGNSSEFNIDDILAAFEAGCEDYGWISVTYEMPDDGFFVLITDANNVEIGWYDNTNIWISRVENTRIDEVTHWQPLPKPTNYRHLK